LPAFQQAQDLPLALAAMAQHAAHELVRVEDRVAMGGIIDAVLRRS
jgi:hypothetical protein